MPFQQWMSKNTRIGFATKPRTKMKLIMMEQAASKHHDQPTLLITQGSTPVCSDLRPVLRFETSAPPRKTINIVMRTSFGSATDSMVPGTH